MKLLSCVFNMDTACVELKFDDGSTIAIDTIAVENEVWKSKIRLFRSYQVITMLLLLLRKSSAVTHQSYLLILLG